MKIYNYLTISGNLIVRRSLVLIIISLFTLTVIGEPLIKKNDRVAVVGDSITEQKHYSRFIELYLTVCQPQIEAEVFQYGINGESLCNFLQRMDKDLRFFKPTVATFCYGMNDGGYKAYESACGDYYELQMNSILDKIKAAGITAIIAGPGAVDSYFFRVNNCNPVIYNSTLESLSKVAQKVAISTGFPYFNLHGLMMESMEKAKKDLGEKFDVCGSDGVHPNPNGHLIMAYGFLKSMGFDGNLGTITVDLKGKATAMGGHEIKSYKDGKIEIESKRYPYCFSGDNKSPQSTASILPYLPFNADLNRLTFIVQNASSENYKVTWGNQSKKFTKKELNAIVKKQVKKAKKEINAVAKRKTNDDDDDQSISSLNMLETRMKDVDEQLKHFNFDDTK